MCKQPSQAIKLKQFTFEPTMLRFWSLILCLSKHPMNKLYVSHSGTNVYFWISFLPTVVSLQTLLSSILRLGNQSTCYPFPELLLLVVAPPGWYQAAPHCGKVGG